MSLEAFTTILSCDMRTATDRRGIDYGRAGEGTPRWIDDRGRGWAVCHPYAHQVLELAARAIEEQPMSGISGDHPEKREQVVALIRATAALVEELAADHACESFLEPERWQQALDRVRRVLAPPAEEGASQSTIAVCDRVLVGRLLLVSW